MESDLSNIRGFLRRNLSISSSLAILTGSFFFFFLKPKYFTSITLKGLNTGLLGLKINKIIFLSKYVTQVTIGTRNQSHHCKIPSLSEAYNYSWVISNYKPLLHCTYTILRYVSNLKEQDRKQLNHDQNESISKPKLFDANFMKIRLQTRKLLNI